MDIVHSLKTPLCYIFRMIKKHHQGKVKELFKFGRNSPKKNNVVYLNVEIWPKTCSGNYNCNLKALTSKCRDRRKSRTCVLLGLSECHALEQIDYSTFCTVNEDALTRIRGRKSPDFITAALSLTMGKIELREFNNLCFRELPNPSDVRVAKTNFRDTIKSTAAW